MVANVHSLPSAVVARECDDCTGVMASQRGGGWWCAYCRLRLELLAPTPRGGWSIYVRNRPFLQRRQVAS